MINKLKFKVNYHTVTPHTPEGDDGEMIIEAYNERRAIEDFRKMKLGGISILDKIEEITEEEK